MPDNRRAPGLRRWSGDHGQKWRAATLATYGTVCHLCRQPGADSADHLIPRSKNGTDTLENLRPAHSACNAARGDLDLGEWFATHPLPTTEPLPRSSRWQ